MTRALFGDGFRVDAIEYLTVENGEPTPFHVERNYGAGLEVAHQVCPLSGLFQGC